MSALERSTPLGLEAMVARSWLLLLGFAAAAGVLQQVGGQRLPDTRGFVSIDCGLPEQGSYVDVLTKLPYTSDAGFTDDGTNYNVSAQYAGLSGRYPQVLNVRSFPGTARSCYTLPTAAPGTSKYLIRATFLYGNYDGLNKLPAFDLYLGVNLWRTVNISAADAAHLEEVIAVVPEGKVQVCLVNTGLGTPFISWLDLRPLNETMYPQVNATQGLALLSRRNFGGAETIRYPDDAYDRAWMPWTSRASWLDISTETKLPNVSTDNPGFHVPSVVMQTAITPLNESKDIVFFIDAEPNNHFTWVLYFSELRLLDNNDVRLLKVTVNGKLFVPPYKPLYLTSTAFYSSESFIGSSTDYNFTIASQKPDSTLPPILNAGEFFSVIYTANVGTEAQDVSAITAIKDKYQVKKNWAGDPCAPKNLAWDGLNCSYPSYNPSTITSINMSLSGLSGDISPLFANLTSIKYLDLSHNNLTGSVPDVLSEMPALVVIDLTGNHLNGPIPSGLLKRIQDGSLTIRYDDNPDLCSSCQPTKKKPSSLTAVYIAVPMVAIAMIIVLVLIIMYKRRNQGSAKHNAKAQNAAGNGDSDLQMDNRRFTYEEIEVITDHFERVLGQGGFGSVYDGLLEDGTRVAVKLRSQSSNQGVREFLTEARILAKIHHKNLVSLVGYCMDRDYLALIYEHMPGGDLEDKLRGIDADNGCLTWTQRLHIALESAQGLDYLHSSCSPPFVHRDVKTSNILLDANLKAKVADFGLPKAFNHDDATHVSTERVVGTHGYLAPEYAAAMHLTEKSDVYSFGVVLLEVVTGQPPIMQCPQPTNIIQWVRQCLVHADIESVVDVRMQEEYDINGVWKVTDLALKCTLQAPAQRPAMTDVVAQLQECLKLEESRTGHDRIGSFYTSTGGHPDSVGRTIYGTTLAWDSNTPTTASGPATR